ncbi:MAG: M23 family metallopeptidase [Candidatus Komeilibacteria bacterium]|nr:M23 family metallopeptidase [Candidatus Komeilibacteria bacterium]
MNIVKNVILLYYKKHIMRYRQRFAPRERHQQSRNKFLAKKTAFQLLAITGNILLLLLKLVAGIFLLCYSLLRFVARLTIKIFGLPLYSIFKKLSVKLQAVKIYLKNQLGKNFSRSLVIYGGLTILFLFASASNLKAREDRPEDIGRSSGLYTLLIQEGDAEILEEGNFETGVILNENSGQEQLSALGVQSPAESLGSANEENRGPLLSESGDAFLRPDMTGTEITPVRRDKIITYMVAEGDTISEIADKFDVSTNTILWENNLGPRDFIKPGQQLSILPVTGLSHTIKKGDSINSLAARYRAQAADIIEVNKLADASDLRVGQKIIVPDGIPISTKPATVVARGSNATIGGLFKNAPAASGHFNWPTISRRISQYYRGWRHTGLDIAAPTGQPVYASDEGVVITAGWNSGGYGLYIIIDHGNGIQTLYGHNSKINVQRGDRVNKGQVIGQVGSTGRSTGPHVHYEVRVNGNRVNPLEYL